MNKHKHQFFEVKKMSKLTDSAKKINQKESEKYLNYSKEHPNKIPLIPMYLEPSIFGVLIMCPCGERRKLWDTGEVEILENEKER